MASLATASPRHESYSWYRTWKGSLLIVDHNWHAKEGELGPVVSAGNKHTLERHTKKQAIR